MASAAQKKRSTQKAKPENPKEVKDVQQAAEETEAPSSNSETPNVESLIKDSANDSQQNQQAYHFGEIFRQRRSQLKVSVEQASRVLRIQARYLQALEDGDFTALPERVFTLGFIRSYGNYLGLDGVILVKKYKPIYDQAHCSKSPATLPANREGMALSLPILSEIPQWLYILGGIIVTCVFMWGWFELLQDDEATQVDVPSVESPAATSVTASTSAEPASSTHNSDQVSTKSSAKQTEATKPATPKAEAAKAPSKQPRPAHSSENKAKAQASEAPNIPEGEAPLS